VRRKAAEEAAELAAKEAAWRQKLRDMNAATKASNDTLLAFRAAERERDKQLEESVEGAAWRLLGFQTGQLLSRLSLLSALLLVMQLGSCRMLPACTLQCPAGQQSQRQVGKGRA
jgi:hypothetical protein